MEKYTDQYGIFSNEELLNLYDLYESCSTDEETRKIAAVNNLEEKLVQIRAEIVKRNLEEESLSLRLWKARWNFTQSIMEICSVLGEKCPSETNEELLKRFLNELGIVTSQPTILLQIYQAMTRGRSKAKGKSYTAIHKLKYI